MMNYEQIIGQIDTLIAASDRVSKSWFWGDNGNASARQWRSRTLSVPRFEWDEGGHHYSAELIVHQSRANTYVRREYYRDGKKTTLTAIKNSRTRLAAESEDM